MNRILLALLFVCFALLGFSQNFKLGVTASPTIGFVSSDNDDVEADGSQIGILYGLMADYRFSSNERYHISTGFVIHHTGGEFASATERYEVAASLIEVPFMFKLVSDEVNLKSFYGQFGVNMGVPVSSKVQSGTDENVEFKGLLAAINIGVGMHYELVDNGVTLNAGLFYDNGFTNVFEIEGEKFRLKHLGLRIGVYF